MPAYDFTPLFDRYPEVVAQMPDTFTSHQFILRLAQQHQRDYVQALYSYRDSTHAGTPDPFRVVHGRLARYLHRCSGLVTLVAKHVPSRDIFGDTTTCAEWRKV